MSDQLFSINNKAGALGDLVVKLHCNGVAFVGLPVNARGASNTCPPVNGFD